MNRFPELNPDRKLARLHHMAEEALRHYDIGKHSVSFVGQSFNAIFRVEAERGEHYVLRVHRFDVYDAIQMRSEFHWLNFLRQSSDFLVSEPIANRNGDFVTELAIDDVAGRHYCTMLRWHPGSPIEVGCHSDHYVMVGKLLANMHSHSSRFVPPAVFVRPWRGVGYARECLTQIRAVARPGTLSPELFNALKAVAEDVERAMADIGHGDRDFGMIHGDLHGGNILLHDG
jgi:Ser/Thr protein kinase RdoA (MazF antagonist)